MALFDYVAPGADTTEVQGGGIGFGDAIGASVAGAVHSGLSSIYNTGAEVINSLGGNVEKLNTYNALDNLDHNWALYYKENKNAIDTAGFIGTSLIPGMLGIKALNMVRAGEGMGATGRALGFFQSKQASNLSAALRELGTEGGSVFTQINANKIAAMGWGAADQVLQGAAFETAVALTMKQSPLLADDSWWDIGKSAMVGAAFGGVIGGGIDALILNKTLKDAVKTLNVKEADYRHIAGLQNTSLVEGDKAMAIVDSLLTLPKQIATSDKSMEVAIHAGRPDLITGWNPATKKVNVDIEKVVQATLTGTEKKAYTQFQLAARELSSDSTAVTPLLDNLLTDLKSLRDGDVTPEVARERMGDKLFGLRKVEAATVDPKYQPGDLFYFRKSIGPDELAKIKTVEDWQNAFISHSPLDNNAYKDPYVFLGTLEQRQQAFATAGRIGKEGDDGFPTLTAAWKAGRDVAFLEDGTVRVNDSSKFWRRVDNPVYSSKQFYNTRTGSFGDTPILTAADRAAPNTELVVTRAGVEIPAAKGPSKFIRMSEVLDEKGDIEYFTARHAWASKLSIDDLPRSIRSDDFSLLDRLSTLQGTHLADINIVRADGSIIENAANISISDLVRSSKLSEAQRLFAEAGEKADFREIAYRLNAEAPWLEEAIAARFRAAMNGKYEEAGRTIDQSKGLSVPLENYLSRQNVLLEFDRPQQFRELDAVTPQMPFREKRDLILDSVANSGGQFVTGELAWAYRVQAAIKVNKNASAGVLGAEDYARFPDLAQNASKLADSTGVGASTFGAANANYGETLKLAVQEAGKQTHLIIQKHTNAAMEQIGNVALRLKQDRKAAAEVGLVTNMLRATDEKYVWEALPTAIPLPSQGPVQPSRMMLKELKGLTGEKLQEALETLRADGRRAYIEVQSPIASEFLRTHTIMNGSRVEKRTLLMNAKGTTSNYDGEVVYVPPIDTTNMQHFAYVRPIEGRAFSTSEVAMVFGRDAAELQKRIAQVDANEFRVITKKETEDFFKAKDLYDFNLTINEPRINTELRRKGVLNNFFPEVRAENVAEDYIRWHQNQTARLVRDAVETNYAQQVTELRALGERYTEVATSKFAGTTKKSSTEVVNPFDDYVKTMLDVSKRSEYTLLHQMNEFVDAMGTRAYRGLQAAFGNAEKGLIKWEEVNAVANKLGIKGPYNNQEEYFLSNVPRDRNLIREGITKANMLLANTVLRLDFFNSVVNTVSTPLMLGTELSSIRSALRKEPELLGKLGEALSVAVPDGSGVRVPSALKLQAAAVQNFFGDRGKELIARYKANGDIKDVLSQYHSMLDNLALRADYKAFSGGVEKAFEVGAKLTGNNWAEEFTRFVSADVMRQLTEPAVQAGKLSLKEQNAFIGVFTNRVQGNYISSQRPIVFQGVLGSAVSLFQTYSFNLMQQLLRHVANKDKRAVATMFGMQAGLFGLNGTPFFEAVNTHIIGNAAINQGHYDAYSIAPELLGKEVGDWLMYGTASAMPIVMGDKQPALYTRGDINPRHMTILPTSISDIPMISASVKVVKNIVDTGSKLSKGGEVVPTLLQGLEHNGINRPLAGFAQVLAGQSTTSKGSLISASSDLDLITTAARIGGSRPMDEAVALNNNYRIAAYRAADRDRREHLGEVVKTKLGKNQFPTDEELDGFMKDFAKAGGRVENFNAALQRWSKDANQSIVNKLKNKVNSSYGQRLSEIMGGEPLEDWTTTVSENQNPQ